jgi:molybdate transport system regulatory protein
MKISARNQFQGRITTLLPGPVNVEVTLALPGGDHIVAVVTQSSVKALGLAVGGQAIAIVKAPWVIVATGDGGPRFSARNQLAGTVSTVTSGPVNAAVAITLAGGAVVHAVVTQDAVAELGLAPGVPARAVIKASHVVLAV